jgi:hypothetical protein
MLTVNQVQAVMLPLGFRSFTRFQLLPLGFQILNAKL